MRRALCLVITLLLAASVCACAPVASTKEKEPAYVSPYTWENLALENGRYTYYKDSKLVSRVGIDVSDHQKAIDWEAVANDGIEFAIIRVGNRGYTEDGLFLDEQFEANLMGAENAGLKCGVYFFSQAISEAEALEEASFVIEALAGRSLEYPVVYDHEPVSDANGRANNLTSDQLTKNTQAFCEAIEQAGYRTMIYGNKKDIGRIQPSVREKHDIWFAEYDASIPSGQFDFIMWQYSSNGEVAGITTRVDMNIHFLQP